MNLSELDKEEVLANLIILKQWVKELHPDLDVERGPFHDVVLYYSAMFATASQQQLREIIKALDFNKFRENPDLVNSKVADKLFGNWLVTRNKGTGAAGNVAIHTDKMVPLVIPHGTVFVGNGMKFKTKGVYATRPEGTKTTNQSDIAYHTNGRDDYYVLIPVESEDAGMLTNIRKGTNFIAKTLTSKNIKRVVAHEAFQGGADEETNKQMLRRVAHNVSDKSVSHRTGIEAQIRKLTGNKIDAVSVIGFGDKEMRRDKSAFWPGNLGGKCDVYIRHSGPLFVKTVELEGTKDDDGNYSVMIEPETAPGFCAATAQDAEIIKIEHDFLESDLAYIPAQTELESTVYTSYQYTTLILKTQDNTESVKTFTIHLQYVPQLYEVQKHLAENNFIDILVKAAIPCFVKIDLIFDKLPNADVFNRLKAKIVEYVNDLRFSGKLSKTSLLQLIAPYLFADTSVTDIIMKGTVKRPDGQLIDVSSDNTLTIPNDPEHYISNKTTSFFIDYEDISIRTQ